MSRFVVDLGNMRLSDPQKHAIAGAIQQAVLAQLASHPPPLGLPLNRLRSPPITGFFPSSGSA
jgi:hypothetical protein